MSIRKGLILFALLVVHLTAYCQSSLSSGGSNGSENTVSLDYSIGQVASATIETSNTAVTQGVLQPLYQIINLTDPDIAVKIDLFPNPTDGLIKIEAQEKFSRISLLTLDGKILKEFDQSIKSIDLSSFSEKFFIINIYSKKQKIKSFKIIKN